eukprot:1193437-Prorocentrum_minimum.AAC.3
MDRNIDTGALPLSSPERCWRGCRHVLYPEFYAPPGERPPGERPPGERPPGEVDTGPSTFFESESDDNVPLDFGLVEPLDTGANSPPAHANSPPLRANSPPARANSPPARANSPPLRANSPPLRANSPPA